MPEPKTAKSDQAKSPKAKSPKAGASDSSRTSLSLRAERSLKDVDRLLKQHPETPPQQQAMTQLEQAKVSALLELAEAIRESKKT